jgi:hypothetical protein
MAALIWPLTNPIQVVKKDLTTNDNIFLHDKYMHKYTVQEFEGGAQYNQKWVLGDKINLQAWADQLQNVSIDVVDCDGVVINNYPATVAIPNFLINNTTYDVLQWSLDTTLWATTEFYIVVKFSPSTATNVEHFVSNPQETVSELVPSLLFKYSNTHNEFNTIFKTSYASNFSQEFYFRVEGRINQVKPEAYKKSYEDQILDLRQLSSKPYNTYYFKIGGAKGIPEYLGEMLNMILSCNTIFLDDNQYTFLEKLDPKEAAYYKLYSYESIARRTEVKYAKVLSICTPPFSTGFAPDINSYEGIHYSYSFIVSGTGPFTVNGTKPNWLNFSILGDVVTLSGTPPVGAAPSNFVLVAVTGKCGTTNFIIPVFNVLPAAACVPMSFVTPFAGFPDAVVGQPYNFEILLNGTAPFTIVNVLNKPLWMNVVGTNNSILITGTPTSITGASESAFITLQVTNCDQSAIFSPGGTLTTYSACTPVSLPVMTVMPTGIIGQPYSFTFTLNGTNVIIYEIVQLSTWLTVNLNIITNVVTITGTPPVGETGGIAQIRFSNCGVPINPTSLTWGDVFIVNV